MGPDGIRLRPDGEPLRVTLWDAIDNIPMDELVAEYWGDVGVAVEINPTTREAFVAALLAHEVDASVWHADVVAAIDMHTRPIWFRPPYGLDTTPIGGGMEWRQWWLTDGAEGEEPPEYYRDQLALADAFQGTELGSDEYYELGGQLLTRTLEQMLNIGTAGEVPYIYVRSNRIQNFPSEATIYIDHLRGAHSDQWFETEKRRIESGGKQLRLFPAVRTTGPLVKYTFLTSTKDRHNVSSSGEVSARKNPYFPG